MVDNALLGSLDLRREFRDELPVTSEVRAVKSHQGGTPNFNSGAELLIVTRLSLEHRIHWVLNQVKMP